MGLTNQRRRSRVMRPRTVFPVAAILAVVAAIFAVVAARRRVSQVMQRTRVGQRAAQRLASAVLSSESDDTVVSGTRLLHDFVAHSGGVHSVRELLGLGASPQVRTEDTDEESVDDDQSRMLNGVGCSSGRTTGIARVITDPGTLANVQKGDVLVCTLPDRRFLPAFEHLGALVTEIGSVSAYGMRVCRERGIPSVQLPEATSLIRDGATVVVDGSSGRVHLEDQALYASLE